MVVLHVSESVPPVGANRVSFTRGLSSLVSIGSDDRSGDTSLGVNCMCESILKMY